MEEAAPLAGAADCRSFPRALCSGFYPARAIRAKDFYRLGMSKKRLYRPLFCGSHWPLAPAARPSLACKRAQEGPSAGCRATIANCAGGEAA